MEEGREINFSSLVSTMPLTELVEKTVNVPDQCKSNARNLKAFSLYLVNLVIKKTINCTDMQRVYCADANVPFHKLVLNSNSSKYLRDKDSFSFQAEVSFSPYKQVNKETLLDQVVDSLKKMSLLKEKDTIIDSSIIELPLAYPVYTPEWLPSRQQIFNFYESYKVFCAGRFGEWLYINADDAIMRGKEAADKIIKEKL